MNNQDGERIAANAALLRLFKGEYRESSDRHSDALLVKDYVEVMEAAHYPGAGVEREHLRQILDFNYGSYLSHGATIDSILKLFPTLAQSAGRDETKGSNE